MITSKPFSCRSNIYGSWHAFDMLSRPWCLQGCGFCVCAFRTSNVAGGRLSGRLHKNRLYLVFALWNSPISIAHAYSSSAHYLGRKFRLYTTAENTITPCLKRVLCRCPWLCTSKLGRMQVWSYQLTPNQWLSPVQVKESNKKKKAGLLQNYFCLVFLPIVIEVIHESSPEHLSLCLPACVCLSVGMTHSLLSAFFTWLLSHCSPFHFPQPSINPQGHFRQTMWRSQYTARVSSSLPAWWALWWCAEWGTLQRNPTLGASQRSTNWASRSPCAAR